MARTTTTLGGGLTDSGTYNWNGAAGDDWVSNWTPTGGYNHGGFTTTAGTTFNTTVKTLCVVRLEMRQGGTATNASAASIYLQLPTANTGAGGFNNSANVHTTTGTTQTFSTGDIAILSSGTVGTIGGTSGAYTYRISGLSSTSSLKPGQWIVARKGTGSIPYALNTISSIVNSTTIALTTASTESPVAGTVSNIFTLMLWDLNSGTERFYGFYTTTAGRIINANGGSTGSYWRQGTLVNSGTKLSGRVTYDTVPSAPGSPGTPGSGTTAGTPAASNVTATGLTLTWCKGSDDGVGTWNDQYILGWQIIYKKSTDSAWSILVPDTKATGEAGLSYDVGTGNYSYDLEGLKPGVTYNFQVSALNHVTHSVQVVPDTLTSVVGLRSLTATVTMLGGVYNGSAWAPIVAKVYDGSSFVTPTTFKVYDGSTWKSLI